MKNALIDGWNSFLKLARFLLWYAIAVAAMFYLLPVAGMFVESQYEAMSGSVKFFSVLGFFSVVVAWQVLGKHDRWRKSLPGKAAG